MSTLKEVLDAKLEEAKESFKWAPMGSKEEGLAEGRIDLAQELLEDLDNIQGALTVKLVREYFSFMVDQYHDDDPGYLEVKAGWIYVPDMVSDLNSDANKEVTE